MSFPPGGSRDAKRNGTAAVRRSCRPRPRKFLLARPEEDWRKLLTPAEFAVLRERGAGCEPRRWKGEYLDARRYPPGGRGAYACRGCGALLYNARSKFDDGSGFCAFDRCLEGRLYCEALELGSGQKVWRAACVGCGSHVARVTRGEMRTHRNERHSVCSLSVRFRDAADLVGARLPQEGPLEIAEADGEEAGGGGGDTTKHDNHSGASPRSNPPAAVSATHKPKTGTPDDLHTYRPCPHLIRVLEQLRRHQSYAEYAEERGHQGSNRLDDAASSVNLPCSPADDWGAHDPYKKNPKTTSAAGAAAAAKARGEFGVHNTGRGPGFLGCVRCLEHRTPMHRCQRAETWLCLSPGCGKALCERYMKTHWRDHKASGGHCVMVTPGMSVYCMTCRRVVKDPRLRRLLRQAHVARFRSLPESEHPSPEARNGSYVLHHKLGYQNAPVCACSICNPDDLPRTELREAVPIPDDPLPPHPSYVRLRGIEAAGGDAQGGTGSTDVENEEGRASSKTRELADRLKGMLVGAALGDALGVLTRGLRREVAHAVFGKLAATKKLNFAPVRLRPGRRRRGRAAARPPVDGHRLGEWTPAMDVGILGLQSLCAFGGRLEVVDAGLRLAKYGGTAGSGGLAVPVWKNGVPVRGAPPRER